MERAEKKIIFSHHVFDRMAERKISQKDVKKALKNGVIIKVCEKSKPHQRCLVLGHIDSGDPLHIVVAIVPDGVLVLTTYIPEIKRWGTDYKTKVV